MRWLRRLWPCRPASSHRSGGRRPGQGGSRGEEVELGRRGQRGWPEGWGCSGLRALRGRWCVPSGLGRAHTPPGLGWAGGGAPPPAGPGLGSSSPGGGGGKVPVTSGSRGSGREGRGHGGAKRPLIGARPSFTPSTMGCGRAHPGSRPSCSLPRDGYAVRPRDPSTAASLETSDRSRGRRPGPAAARGREDRKGDEFQNQSFTPTR